MGGSCSVEDCQEACTQMHSIASEYNRITGVSTTSVVDVNIPLIVSGLSGTFVLIAICLLVAFCCCKSSFEACCFWCKRSHAHGSQRSSCQSSRRSSRSTSRRSSISPGDLDAIRLELAKIHRNRVLYTVTGDKPGVDFNPVVEESDSERGSAYQPIKDLKN